MCGICGDLRFDTSSASISAIEAMLPCLERRGPDAQGQWANGPAAFGHRRLKIIDLSERGAQPMIDPESGRVLVFNGCIYNYPELRDELIGKGHAFHSHSDTEVILKAWLEWGPDALQKLNGMFAFALHDPRSGETILARDRLGIKPLYLAETPGGLRFASTLPALLAAGGIDTSLDPVALHHYMSFHAVVPAPHTILNGVRKLQPGHWMRIGKDGTREEHEFWALHFGPQPGDEALSEADWTDLTLETLRTAVRRRLVADVPVGVLLSGGVDSSLITGLLAEEGQTGLNTFSVGFESAGGEEGNEFRYSDVIAEHYNTTHHQLPVGADEVLANLDDCIRCMSEPMVSHDVIGFYLLSREVSKHIKVVQSGQGADEIFGGYHWYPPLLTSTDPVSDYARVFFDRDQAGFAEAVFPKWVSKDFSRAFVEKHFAMPGADRAVDKALRLDTTIMLVDDPVKRVDNTTMSWGLEARVPFLDHEVAELGARIPAELKLKGDGKHVLKEAARKVIPAAVIDRPKGYFPVPALKYLDGPYLERVRDSLLNDTARSRGLFRPEMVETLLADPAAHITPLRGSKLWQISLLETWLQLHGL
jgi:asparagine synthase (glutamine-hydrolysing)